MAVAAAVGLGVKVVGVLAEARARPLSRVLMLSRRVEILLAPNGRHTRLLCTRFFCFVPPPPVEGTSFILLHPPPMEGTSFVLFSCPGGGDPSTCQMQAATFLFCISG